MSAIKNLFYDLTEHKAYEEERIEILGELDELLNQYICIGVEVEE